MSNDPSNRRRTGSAACSRLADFFDATGQCDDLPEALQSHVAGCDVCRELLETLLWADALLESTANAYGPPPPTRPEDVEAAIRIFWERQSKLRPTGDAEKST